jgi:hypothetical protein
MSMEVVGSADPEDRVMRVLSQAAWAAVAWRFWGDFLEAKNYLTIKI